MFLNFKSPKNTLNHSQKIISQAQKIKNRVPNGTSSNPNYPKLLMITIVTKIKNKM